MVFKLFSGFFFLQNVYEFLFYFSEKDCFWKTRRIKSCTYGEEKKHFHIVKIIYICVALISMVWYSRVVFDKKMQAKNFVFFNRKPVSYLYQPSPQCHYMSLLLTSPRPLPPTGDVISKRPPIKNFYRFVESPTHVLSIYFSCLARVFCCIGGKSVFSRCL